jgi:hypothetical protein
VAVVVKEGRKERRKEGRKGEYNMGRRGEEEKKAKWYAGHIVQT